MYFNEFSIILALFHLLECGVIHLKRDVKHIDTSKLDDIMASTATDQKRSRSFLECSTLCRQTDACFSVFYKDNKCWFVLAGVKFSLNSCFQTKSGATTAFVGLNEVCLSGGSFFSKIRLRFKAFARLME